MNNPDYSMLVSHQDEGDKGWRAEVYDTANGGSPDDPENRILIFAIENVDLYLALREGRDAIERDQARVMST